MASPAADFSGQRPCSGRRGRPSLAGRGGAPVAALHPSRTAASSTSPGDTSQPLAAPPAGARRGWKGERAARRRFPADLPAAPTRAAPKGFIPDTGSRRPPLALRETRKAGPPLHSSQSPPITVSAPQQGPPGRATTKLCLGPSEWSPVKLGEVSDPKPFLRASPGVGLCLPTSWWPGFLFPPQGRKEQWDNLRKRTKLAPPRSLQEPGRLPSSPSWDYLEGWHFFPPFKIFFLATTV